MVITTHCAPARDVLRFGVIQSSACRHGVSVERCHDHRGPCDRILPGSPEWADLLARSAPAPRTETSTTRTHLTKLPRSSAPVSAPCGCPTHRGGAGFTVPQLFSAVIDVAHADPIVAHIFRTHFWFVEERLRTADDPSSARWLHKVAEGKIFGNAFSEKGSLAVGSLVFNTRLLPDRRRLPARRREVLQHRHAVLRLPDRHRHHRPRLGRHRGGARRPGRCAADRRLGRLRAAPHRHRHHGVHQRGGVDRRGPERHAVRRRRRCRRCSTRRCSCSSMRWSPASSPAVVDDGVALLRSRDRSFSHALTERPDRRPAATSGSSANSPAPRTIAQGRGARRRRGHRARPPHSTTTDGVPRRRSWPPRPSSRSPRSRCTSTTSRRRPPPGCWSSAGPARPAGSATWTGTGATSAPSRCTTRWPTRRG